MLLDRRKSDCSLFLVTLGVRQHGTFPRVEVLFAHRGEKNPHTVSNLWLACILPSCRI